MTSAFPIRFPIGLLLGLVVGLSLMAGGVAWKVRSLSDDQRFYLKTYYQSGVDELAEKMGRHPGKRFYGVRVGGQPGIVRVSPGRIHAWLSTAVYHNVSPLETFRLTLVYGFCGLFLCCALGRWLDVRRQRYARWGEHVRGTRLVSWRQANREALAESPEPGIRIRVGRFGQKLIIPRELESHHIAISGSTGMGKSTLIREILYQVEARGETAILYDPKGEYRDEFYLEERGDVILDPGDERCPYWAIEEEAEDESRATPWGLAFFPDEPRQQPFFKKHPREILAFLMDRYSVWNEPRDPATCQSLGHWLAHPRTELQKRLKGTTYAVSVDPAAKDQSQGLFATLGEIAKPLRIMPPKEEGRAKFSVREWSKKRQGWIFMTSTPDTVDSLLPLHSAVMDMLILKNQAPKRSSRVPVVWVIMDEVATLQRLPQLEAGETKQRASGNPIVIGYHDMAQLKERYGENGAITILSQAFTNVILRCGDAQAAKHGEMLIAHEEIERISENRPVHAFGSHRRGRSWSSQRPVVPVVMAAEIQGQRRFRGYWLQEGRVVKMDVQKLAKRVRTERLERLIPPLVVREPEEPKAAPVNDVPPSPAGTTQNLTSNEGGNGAADENPILAGLRRR